MSGLSGTRSALRLGFYFARAYWGIGLASEAARAFVRFGFDDLHVDRILADADDRNAASRRILEKLRFQMVRTEKLPSGRVICHYELRG
jgi:RimJ/RimL family protein N-acetyltransferase